MRNISQKWPSQIQVENEKKDGGATILFCLVTIKLFYVCLEMDITHFTLNCAVHALFFHRAHDQGLSFGR
jgi:hypothetical protein